MPRVPSKVTTCQNGTLALAKPVTAHDAHSETPESDYKEKERALSKEFTEQNGWAEHVERPRTARLNKLNN